MFSRYMTFRKWHGALVCPWKSSQIEIDGKRSKEGQEPLELKEQLHCSRRGIVNFAVNNVRSFSAVCCTDKPLWFIIAQKADLTLNSIWVQL